MYGNDANSYLLECIFEDGTLTKCERHVQKALIEGSSYVPRCKRDGTYEKVQCDGTNSSCWCVDKDGKRVPQIGQGGRAKCADQGNLQRSQPYFKRMFFC